jgi:hypothetical protein
MNDSGIRLTVDPLSNAAYLSIGDSRSVARTVPCDPTEMATEWRSPREQPRRRRLACCFGS